MPRRLATIPPVLFLVALCGCDAFFNGGQVSAKWMVSGAASVDLPGIDLDAGTGAEIACFFPEACDASGFEMSVGTARYPLAGSAEHAREYWVRGGYRNLLWERGRLFTYGDIGFSLDVLDSAAFPALSGYLLDDTSLPFAGAYARAGLGVRSGHALLTVEAWAVAAARRSTEGDSLDGFSSVAASVGLGAAW